MVMVAGFGNPVMDCLLRIDNNMLLQKHNLKEDDAKEISIEELDDLMKDIGDKQYECIYNPGGCALNTLRILQWIIGVDNSTVMFGSVGNDKNGELLKGMVESSDVSTRFAIQDKEPTGLMVSLVYGETRTLVGNIGAAGSYHPDNIDEETENADLLKTTSLIFVEAFFLTCGRHVAGRKLLKFCEQNKLKLVFNLCAPYIIEALPEDVALFANKAHILVGNRREFETLAKTMKYKSVEEMIVTLARALKDKMVIMTDGANDVLLAYYPDELHRYPTKHVDKNEIVDTTGCGDSFIAGFIGCYLKRGEPRQCVKWGEWVAQQVIRRMGCNVANACKDTLFQIKE